LIGYEAFSEATKIYFEKFQWRNTVLGDFLGCLDEAYEKCPKKTENIVVSKWASTFLNTRGANVFSGAIEGNQLTVTQEVPEFSEGLRQQKVDVLFFNDKFETEIQTFMTTETNATVNVTIDDPEKKFFILNHGDNAYGKIILNAETCTFLSKKLNGLDDSLTRALVWKGKS
jgi:aminopeptidase N